MFNHVDIDLPKLSRETIDGVRYYNVPDEDELIKLVSITSVTCLISDTLLGKLFLRSPISFDQRKVSYPFFSNSIEPWRPALSLSRRILFLESPFIISIVSLVLPTPVDAIQLSMNIESN